MQDKLNALKAPNSVVSVDNSPGRFVTFYWYLIAGGLVMLFLGFKEARPLMNGG